MILATDRLGQDSEFFLWDTQKDALVPSYEFFKKRDEEKEFFPREVQAELPPFKRTDYSIYTNSGGKCRVFRDGMAVEVNTEAFTCRAWGWQDIRFALHYLSSRLPDHIRFTTRPWARFHHMKVRKFPADLKELGCLPSFDAYSMAEKAIGVDPVRTYFRTSGSHLHRSFLVKPTEEQTQKIIKLADLLIGLPHTYIFGDELEFRRRALYGQAGEFRFQKYPHYTSRYDYTKHTTVYTLNPSRTIPGVEYRVLSSRVWNHPAIWGLFSGLWKSVVTLFAENLFKHWDSSIEDDLREAINLGTPKLFPRLLQEGTRVMKAAAAETREVDRPYTYGPLTPKILEGEVPVVWQKLKALNAQGTFPDAGVVYLDNIQEAHYGWSEYAGDWGLLPKF